MAKFFAAIPHTRTAWQRTVLLLSCTVLLLGVMQPIAQAETCAKGISQAGCESIYGGWVDWVRPGDCSLSSSAGITPLRGADNREKIWNFLHDKGLTNEQAAGVMGNMQTESASTWSPVVHQSQVDPWNSTYPHGFGIVQWDGGRRYKPVTEGGVLGSLKKSYPDLAQYADPSYDPRQNPKKELPAGVEVSLLSFELNYMYQESVSRNVTYTAMGVGENEWATLQLQQTVENATVFWHNNFEVSADSPEAVLQNRGGHAQAILDYFATHATSSESSCTNLYGFDGTVLGFAWPTYKPAESAGGAGIPDCEGWCTRKQPYIDAVNAAIENGIYRGGYQGVDCGGFVTLLMLNSGFEPNYNYAGKIGDGAENVANGQTPWLQANWTSLGPADDIDPATLRKGDVAVSPTHTFVYVGDVPGFDAKIASASFGNRAPMADNRQSPTASGFTWYRKP